MIGLATNTLLAAVKIVTGVLSNSITFILDGIHSLTEGFLSILTIVGTRLSQKLPDKQHPMGYGRIEYLTSFIIAALILYTGISSIWESIEKIMKPGVPDYSTLGLVLIALTLVVKHLLGKWTERKGQMLNSSALEASGKGGRDDALVTISTLAAAFLYLAFKINVSGWLGILISLAIIRTGMEILKKSISELLGQRVSGKLAREIKKEIRSVPGVEGVYDLLITNYGPNTRVGSCHIEVLNSMTMNELYVLEQKISEAVFNQFGIVMSGISIYTRWPKGSEVDQMEQVVRRIVMRVAGVVEMHGFYVQPEKKTMAFDTILSFDEKDLEGKKAEIIHKVHKAYPDYRIEVILDRDLSE